MYLGITWLFPPEALLIGGETTHSWAGLGQAAERLFWSELLIDLSVIVSPFVCGTSICYISCSNSWMLRLSWLSITSTTRCSTICCYTASGSSCIWNSLVPILLFRSPSTVLVLRLRSEFNPIPSYECIICYFVHALDRIELAGNRTRLFLVVDVVVSSTNNLKPIVGPQLEPSQLLWLAHWRPRAHLMNWWNGWEWYLDFASWRTQLTDWLGGLSVSVTLCTSAIISLD